VLLDPPLQEESLSESEGHKYTDFFLLVGLGFLKEFLKEFLVVLGLRLKDFLLLAMRTFLVLWSSIRIPLATLISHVSLGLPTIFLTVLA
jgi:hypothetical protein